MIVVVGIYLFIVLLIPSIKSNHDEVGKWENRVRELSREQQGATVHDQETMDVSTRFESHRKWFEAIKAMFRSHNPDAKYANADESSDRQVAFTATWLAAASCAAPQRPPARTALTLTRL